MEHDLSDTTCFSLLADLIYHFGKSWAARGYMLTETNTSFSVEGDTTQFYLDAVADDADAVPAMEFLRLHAPATYDMFRAEARYDDIDLDESQKVFMRGRTLDSCLQTS